MQKLQQEGFVRALGVSNFTIAHLQAALATGVKISNNQVEFHPSLNQKELKAFCDTNGIKLTAYSPIAQGADLKLPVIVEIATKHVVSPAQVILNWVMTKGMVVIPKATTEAHLQDNWAAQNWQLDPAEIAQIDAVGGENRIVWPNFAEF
jgi:2,5-diketo-D-gluconate reductase B